MTDVSSTLYWQERDLVEAIPMKCAGCGGEVITYWSRDNGGLISNPLYDLIGDTIWHSSCWAKQAEKLNQEENEHGRS